MTATPRRVRYQVAASLDGFIADAQGGADWIVMDPDIDFAEHFAQFDTFLIGRRTYESVPHGEMPGVKVLVFSRTLRQEDHPNVTIVAADEKRVIEELKAQPGKDIWLFGGGELFRSLLELGLVDTVEVAVIPVLLGGGIPLLPATAVQKKLSLGSHKIFPKSGIVLLNYVVLPTKAKKKHGTTPVLS